MSRSGEERSEAWACGCVCHKEHGLSRKLSFSLQITSTRAPLGRILGILYCRETSSPAKKPLSRVPYPYCGFGFQFYALSLKRSIYHKGVSISLLLLLAIKARTYVFVPKWHRYQNQIKTNQLQYKPWRELWSPQGKKSNWSLIRLKNRSTAILFESHLLR